MKPTSAFLYSSLSLVALALAGGCSIRASAKEQSEDAFGGKREAVTLVVFNDDFAQITEKRPFELKAGSNKLRLGDVSAQLDPSSVLFSWSQQGLQVVSNTYDLGVGSSQNLMQRYVGSPVEMVWYGQNGKPGDTTQGTLEMANESGVVIKAGDKLMVNPTGTLVAPAKSDVVTIPQLSLGVEAPSNASANLDVTYLTRGLSWSADYVATISPDSDDIRLECWASVVNKTGAKYPDAKITLMAGSPNRAATSMDYPMRGAGGAYTMAKTESGIAPMQAPASMAFNAIAEPQAVGEMYAYPIKAKSTIAQDQINRVRMMYGDKVKVVKDYSVRLNDYSFYNYDGGNYANNGVRSGKKISAALAIAFYNKKEDGLGVPLPRGTVRIYEPGPDGAKQYVGAAAIYDTPEEGRVNLTISSVFNVSAEPTLMKVERIDKKRARRTYSVKLTNRKKSQVELRLVQSFYGTWRIESESVKSGKLDARTNQWKVPLPADGEVVLKYAVVTGG